jgi:hypothetical protein
MREVPFPVIEGERMVIEAIVYRRMAKRYLIRFFNVPTTVKDYQSTGLTATSRTIWRHNPKTVTLYLGEMVADGDATFKTYVNYFRYALHARAGFNAWRQSPSKLWSAAAVPLGGALHLRDRIRAISPPRFFG